MAVQQISQVQVRRGFLQDLGQLSSGEFGWAIDQRRLYIGNGTIAEGAPLEGVTEIMTRQSLLEFYTGASGATGATGTAGMLDFPYRFKGVKGGYEVQTGTSIAAPTVRTLQNKVDDIINVLDFGAIGDGIANDLAAIQRAIDQTYDRLDATTDTATRRVINFHPGVYMIFGELRLPPYCVLRGAGRDSVIIRQGSPAATTSIKLTNSLGANDSTISSTGGITPGPVEIANITFDTTFTGDRSLVVSESASNVRFHACRFLGSTPSPTANDNSTCVRISSVFLASRGVFFTDCDFYGMSTAARLTDTNLLEHVVFEKCRFSDHVNAIQISTTKTYSQVGLRITACIFDRIQREAVITGTRVSGVTSLTNSYLNVGTNYLSTEANIANIANIAPLTSVISFGGTGSYSFGDVFLRPSDVDFTLPTIRHGAPEIVSIDTNTALRLGARYQTIGRSVLVPSGSINYVPLSGRFMSGLIHYNVERLNRYRSGTITYSVDPVANTVCWRDSFTEIMPTNIVLEMEYSTVATPSRKPVLVIKSAGSGFDPSVITYDVKSQDYKQLTDDVVANPVLSNPWP